MFKADEGHRGHILTGALRELKEILRQNRPAPASRLVGTSSSLFGLRPTCPRPRRREKRIPLNLSGRPPCNGAGLLFDRDALGQVPRLIDVAPEVDGKIVGEKLERNHRKQGRKKIRAFRNEY